MLTCESLYKCTKNPRINEISLDLLLSYYEKYLMPFIYRYNIKNESGIDFNIELRFDKRNFCHLLGIESIVKYTVNRDEIINYKSEKGWERIKSGELNFTELKGKNKRGFNDCKSKYVFFYLIPKIIDQPKAVIYDKTKVQGGTRIDCKMIFYDQLQNSYVHLALEYDEELNYYIARSFLIEKITEKNTGKKFIDNQDEIIVSKIEE